MEELKRHQTDINYTADIDRLHKFLLFYTEDTTPKYLSLLRTNTSNLKIHLTDISLYDDTNLTNRILNNTFTYISLLYKAIDNILYNENEVLFNDEDDIFLYHRIARLKERQPDKKVTDVFPSLLLRNYHITLIPPSNIFASPLRHIKACDIGKLIKVRGVITKASQVKPIVRVATYICESCGSETYQQVNSDTFVYLSECPSERCKIRKVKGTLTLQSRGSKFMKYQTLKLQEHTYDVPQGCVPRNITIECYGDTTDQAKPGDTVTISGIFLPKPFYGYKKIKAGLLTDTFLYALEVISNSNNSSITDTNIISSYSINPSFTVTELSQAIAPEIFGLSDVKKILLLMLVGAPCNVRSDGMKIRGEINVLLLGDPGVAKSQLLKTVIKIAERGVYCTGRGSSGVGLTASVLRDKSTGESVLEGGALVLSDGGVCCVDELDKMNEVDRMGIYEVMEQQTVSVSKAGINCTLNARCSLLGAANPVRGKYDTKKSVEHNVGLPCALISRFDALVVLKDDPDVENDMRLASHITGIFMGNEIESTVDYQKLQNIIKASKSIFPVIPNSLLERMSDIYVEERKDNNMITPRYLLSLIRLSLAHSRLRMSQIVNEEDVEEAVRLMERSKRVLKREKKEFIHPKHEFYNMVVNMFKKSEIKEMNIEELKSCVAFKFKNENVDLFIEEFEKVGIWVVRDNKLILL
ncbi:Mcm2-7 hexameric complex component [Hamiltosporidium tvaerminnensis]|nr:Mcm2-7 hexameric complex component [Hamiltosporidium tvaerminnensis]